LQHKEPGAFQTQNYYQLRNWITGIYSFKSSTNGCSEGILLWKLRIVIVNSMIYTAPPKTKSREAA